MIVIGGGISGLYVAWKRGASLLLEAAPRVGGRVRTVRRDDQTVDYEGGPWRIHHSHRRVLSLVRELGLETERTTSSSIGLEGGALSVYDRNLLDNGVAEANRMELESGYEGFGEAAAEDHSYSRHETGAYYVVRTGFDSLVREMRERVECPVRVNTRVTDVRRDNERGEYVIEATVRDGTSFRDVVHRCDRVVFAVPPHRAEQWEVCRTWLRAQIHAVRTLPLHHVYGSVGESLPATHAVDPESLLSQVVSGDHNGETFQVSYSGGRRARFWNRLKMEDPGRFKEVLQKELRKHLPEPLRERQLRNVRSHHFEHAVHYWVPAFGFKGNEESARRSVAPHPNRLPGLFWVGEAFSSVQGWIEGALETAEAACLCMDKGVVAWREAPLEKGELVVEGRVVRVEEFSRVHPGSEGAIRKYEGKDATKVFEHIHPGYSWALVYSLQV